VGKEKGMDLFKNGNMLPTSTKWEAGGLILGQLSKYWFVKKKSSPGR